LALVLTSMTDTKRRKPATRVVARAAWTVATLFFMLAPLAGCAYRFTNLHVDRPGGIRTIAIESVYDTSREVLPHEIIWENFQRALAADGNLQVVHRSKADAIMLIHVERASLTPTGNIVKADPTERDPDIAGGEAPPAAQQIRRLPEAGRFMDRSAAAIQIRVEVWNLNSRAKLLDRTYNQSATLISVRPSTPREINFLREDEAYRARMDAMTAAIATNAVQDLLVR